MSSQTNKRKGRTRSPLKTWHRKQANRRKRVKDAGGHVQWFRTTCKESRELSKLPKLTLSGKSSAPTTIPVSSNDGWW